jgi:hypothetical protein
MSFYAEGTMTYTSRCGVSVGDYRFLEDDLIRIDMRPQHDQAAYSRILELRIEGDKLELVSMGQSSAPTVKLIRTSSRQPPTATAQCPAAQPQ